MDPYEPKKGTTTVGIVCEDGVILAADKRATAGGLIANKEVEKIQEIQSHLGMTIAGLVSDAQALTRIMRVQTALYETQRNKKISVEGATTLLANIMHSRYFPYWVQLVMGGYDTKPRLYSLGGDGSSLEEKYVSTGSGSPVAYGVLEDRYKEGMTIKEALPLAARAIKNAMERDSYSGNGIDLVTITKKGYDKLSQKEVEALLK